MPKAVVVPPSLNLAQLPPMGTKVTITEVKELVDQMTSIGTTKHGIALTVDVNGAKFSQMFSLDKAEIAGSAGRVLVSVGIVDTEANTFKEDIKKLIGKQFTVVNRGGKIYWYP